MSSASRGLAPHEGLDSWLMKMGRVGLPSKPRHGPQASKSGDPRSQNTNRFLHHQHLMCAFLNILLCHFEHPNQFSELLMHAMHMIVRDERPIAGRKRTQNCISSQLIQEREAQPIEACTYPIILITCGLSGSPSFNLQPIKDRQTLNLSVLACT